MTVISSPNASNLTSGLLGYLVSNSASSQSKLTQLTEQASSGLVAQTYGGMGASAQISLNLRPQMSAVTAYGQNISTANTQLSVTSQSLDQLQQIASTMSSGLLSVNAETSQGVTALAVEAKAALVQVQSLLNTQVGNKYIFAGQDSSNQPLPDTQLNAFVAAVQLPMATLTTNGATATIASAMTAATTISPFSTTLGTTPELASVGVGITTPVGIVAGQNAYVTQTGANTTGSYVRDLISSLATMAAMTPAQLSTDPTNFNAVLTNTLSSLQNTMSVINNENAGVGSAQQTLTADQTSLTDMTTALTTQVSNVENVDAASTAAALAQAQTQLQISYKLIASSESMSLVTYLP